jgi:glycosyltransferase involved in cell wall biosynthesis
MLYDQCNRMANILFVNPTSVHGGAEEALLELMQAAIDLGFTPFLAVPNHGWLTEKAEAKGIAVYTIPALPDPIHIRQAWRQFLPLPATVAGICLLIGRLRIELVHANSPRTAYHSGIAARLMRVRAVTHVHDIVNVPYLHRRRSRLLQQVSDMTLVPSQAVQRALRSTTSGGPQPMQVLYNGRRVEQYATPAADLRMEIGAPPNAFLIGGVSVMNPYKGQDHTILAFEILKRRHPDAHLVIVGDGQGSAEQAAWHSHLKKMVQERSLGAAVHFLGWREDVFALMRAFDLFVHSPVQPDPLPNVCIHALALGVPSIGYDIGGVGEIIVDGECGRLAPARNIDALAECMELMYGDPALRAAYSTAARRHFAARFSYDQFVERVSAIYSAVGMRPR